MIHYDYSLLMVLDYDMWHNQKLPHGIFIEFWNIYIYTYVGQYIVIGR
jgi:hypothetical protein